MLLRNTNNITVEPLYCPLALWGHIGASANQHTHQDCSRTLGTKACPTDYRLYTCLYLCVCVYAWYVGIDTWILGWYIVYGGVQIALKFCAEKLF